MKIKFADGLVHQIQLRDETVFVFHFTWFLLKMNMQVDNATRLWVFVRRVKLPDWSASCCWSLCCFWHVSRQCWIEHNGLWLVPHHYSLKKVHVFYMPLGERPLSDCLKATDIFRGHSRTLWTGRRKLYSWLSVPQSTQGKVYNFRHILPMWIATQYCTGKRRNQTIPLIPTTPVK